MARDHTSQVRDVLYNSRSRDEIIVVWGWLFVHGRALSLQYYAALGMQPHTLSQPTTINASWFYRKAVGCDRLSEIANLNPIKIDQQQLVSRLEGVEDNAPPKFSPCPVPSEPRTCGGVVATPYGRGTSGGHTRFEVGDSSLTVSANSCITLTIRSKGAQRQCQSEVSRVSHEYCTSDALVGIENPFMSKTHGCIQSQIHPVAF